MNLYKATVVMKEIEKETPRIAEVIEVIHTEAIRGSGTEDNPVRVVHQYWSLSGELLAKKDQS